MIPKLVDARLDGLRLEAQRNVPLHQQISEAIKRRIASGVLPVGARLPSSRDLASQLGASRATVELAYGNLAAEGYVARRSAAGTRVLPLRTEAPAPALQTFGARLMPGLASEAAQLPKMFQMGLPALDAFPRKLWSRLAARHARALSVSKMVYQQPGGFAPLRRAIANHLAMGRGLACTARQVFVTCGFLGALSLASRAALTAGDKVLVEDPGFPPAREAIKLGGGIAVPVPVDGLGMDFAAGISSAPDARAVLITPVAQFPLGGALSASRREQMLAWASSSHAWVLQDDYEENLNGVDRTASWSASVASAERVLHLGSFSNLLFPGFRLGYLVAPESLVGPLEHAAALQPANPSLLDQMVVFDFIAQGLLVRHLARMKSLYAERRLALRKALNEAFGPLGHAESCGMHVLLRLRIDCDDVALAALARSHGMAVNALSPMGVNVNTGPGLLLGYTNILPAAAMDAALCLRNVLQDKGPSPAEPAPADRCIAGGYG
ncbi:HTH-type transcriptional regulatory protein GabR [Variovorax sp. PBS-H4]|uniref:aminotransferase-like domain-containing protein n=1 Tax=Variovorax sp. PBS-H4 TaxID=434008 RepID=UPI0013185C36|nr:PLP-dependent aminotransferase family protein [Variovorax sp. PBS-H4]VTU25781.1 HTH-type transcriptional regulatory protein GabR [Variovorax sp. PBS-H4]